MNRKVPLSIILIFVLLFCSGCSKVTFGYNYFDWYLLYKINGYTSFNAEQKAEIHREVDHYMRWHRKNALPEYTRYLQGLHDDIQQRKPVHAEDIARIKSDSYRLYIKTMGPFILPAARLLKGLDARQKEQLARTFEEITREQNEESLSGDNQADLERRAERTLDFVEDLVGSLSREQREKIRGMSLRLPFASRHYIENRETNQARLMTLLNGNAEEDEIAGFFWLWLNFPEATRTYLQQQTIKSYEHATNEMTAQIYALLTDRQRNRLREKILSYIEDFQSLGIKTGTAAAPP